MTQHTFLVEIGTEELPAKELRILAQHFVNNFQIQLDANYISYNNIDWFAAPRRLAIKVHSINSIQTKRYIEKRGPAIHKAFDAEGQPTKAAIGWASSCGISINKAERFTTDKGEWLIYRMLVNSQPVQQLICRMVYNALTQLSSLTKIMRWSAKNYQFIRPVRTVTLLLDDQLIPGNIFGINSDRRILGHRFMGNPVISLLHAEDYPNVLLERGRVIADYERRKEIIHRNIEITASKVGGVTQINNKLLDEVTSLVDWPIILIASFEAKFLIIPAEALIYTIEKIQKCFPVYNADGKLLPYFIFVTNIESINPHKIIMGHETVMRSRLTDVEFFFNIDRKQKLEDYLPLLGGVKFHMQLGTLLDKSYRLEILASWIAELISTNVQDIKQAARAARISKCDLMTKMVFEYPEIQGIIGMYYAQLDGEHEYISLAQKEQYQPLFSGDKLPTTLISCAVAIADKIDTLTGMFGICQYPKPDKDPLALRRTAIGILRIIIEKKLSIDLLSLIKKSTFLYQNKLSNKMVVEKIIDFMLHRLIAWYKKQGYSIDTIHAILAVYNPTSLDVYNPTRKLIYFDARLRAVHHFRQIPHAENLTKRIFNIIAKNKTIIHGGVNINVLKQPEEIILMNSLTKLQNKLQLLFEKHRYQDALYEIVSLNEAIDAFFSKVIIMTEDKELCINRLNILNEVRQLLLNFADFSLLQ